MNTFDARLRRREEAAHGTTAFRFDKPAGFGFKPGQADPILSDPPDADSAPREAMNPAGVDDDDIRSKAFHGH